MRGNSGGITEEISEVILREIVVVWSGESIEDISALIPVEIFLDESLEKYLNFHFGRISEDIAWRIFGGIFGGVLEEISAIIPRKLSWGILGEISGEIPVKNLLEQSIEESLEEYRPKRLQKLLEKSL